MKTTGANGLIRCPLCGDEASDLFQVPDWLEKRRLFDLKRCRGCELAFVHPIPSEIERLEWRGSESHYYGLVRTHREELRRGARELLDRLAEVRRPPGRLLDVGAGQGLLLAEAACRGWDALGVESSPDACRAMQEQRLTVVSGDFLDVELPGRSFDVVLLQQVVEHSTSPRELVRRACELLVPDGVLYVGTPNATGLLARSLGRAFNYWIPPEHVFHYGPRSLRYLLEKNGFEVADLRTFFGDPPLANDLRDITRHHPWLRRLPHRIVRRALEAVRPLLERRGDGTILEVFARPVRHVR
ncbi:MAG: class I SAM-dependent methyltransferase [Candidatus Binatia bacterium]